MRQTRIPLIVAPLLLLTAAGTSGAASDPIADLTRARASEALDLTKRAGDLYWPTLKVEKISLLVVDPGRGALLFNHPNPPAPFTAAGHMPRHYPEPADPNAPAPPEAAGDPGWSVHAIAEAAVSPYRCSGSSLTIAGRRTACVTRDEVSVPPPPFPGLPPSEAVIAKMMGALFLAHVDDREGAGKPVDPAAYRVDAEDLSLIALEQRLLAWTLRIQYNEKTLAQYHKLAAEWLAVRRARLARNPRAVAIEEGIERREGLADYTETLPARILDNPGREKRESLEKVDPFFDRYANHFILRVDTINYPVLWYPHDAATALRRARATGAALAGIVWPMSPKWNQSFFGEEKPLRRTLREAIEEALAARPPEGSPSDADLLKAASEREGLAAIRALMQASRSGR